MILQLIFESNKTAYKVCMSSLHLMQLNLTDITYNQYWFHITMFYNKIQKSNHCEYRKYLLYHIKKITYFQSNFFSKRNMFESCKNPCTILSSLTGRYSSENEMAK